MLFLSVLILLFVSGRMVFFSILVLLLVSGDTVSADVPLFLVRGSPCLCTVWSYAFFLSVSFGCGLYSGRTLYLVRLCDSSLIFCRSLPSRLFLRKVLFWAFPGLGCVGFSVPFQLAETSGGRLVPLCPRQHLCLARKSVGRLGLGA